MSITHNRGLCEISKGNAPWISGTFKVMLATALYVPNRDHNFISQASGNELSGSGYVAGFAGSGRKALTNKAVTQDDTLDAAVMTADASTWLLINAGIAAYAIVYFPVTNDADSFIIATLNIGPFTTNGTDLVINYPVAADGGLFKIRGV